MSDIESVSDMSPVPPLPAWPGAAPAPGATIPVPVVSGLEQKLLRLRLWRRIAQNAYRAYGHPRLALAALREVARARHRAAGGLSPRKYVVEGGRVFFSLHAPGFPSAAFDRYTALELNRVIPFEPRRGLQSPILAVTRRCGLLCAHCSEWETLRQPVPLSVDDLLHIAADLRSAGAPQIQLSGGEPLLRLDAVEAICKTCRDACDLWIATSGAPLTAASRKGPTGNRASRPRNGTAMTWPPMGRSP
jgi:hypothetical protein